MDSAPSDLFCSLDLLAEVASATLHNDPTLISNMHLQESIPNNKNLKSTAPFQFSPKSSAKVNNASTRRSVNSADKLTLDQIKCLSEKNLIEMFSEHICDEMKRNYSFQCYLIPDKCSQVFNSFGNEMRARCNIKAHLLSHIKDLVAAANAPNNQEIFMAEPLHIRRKRLKEITRKNTRKKKQLVKPLPNKNRRNNSYEHVSVDSNESEIYKAEVQPFTKSIPHVTHNPINKVDFDIWSSEYINCISQNGNDYVNDASSEFKHLSHFSSGSSECIEVDKISARSYKKQKSKHDAESRSEFQFDLEYEECKSHLTGEFQSDSDISLPIFHDHTYTSVNGKTFDFDSSYSEESSKSYVMFRDSFESKIAVNQCLKREYPLTIPTPPFPYVYIPVLPHIALIQEIGYSFKSSGCKCKNIGVSEGHWGPHCFMPKTMHHSLPKKNECLRNSVHAFPRVTSVVDANNPSGMKRMDFFYGNISNGAVNDYKLPGPSFYVDLLKPGYP